MTYSLVEAEEEESLEVVIANAVADPRAVMVHFGHANVAYAAVMRAQRLPVATLLAVQVLVRRGHLRDHFWLFECCHCVGEQRHEYEGVEEDFYELAVDFVGHPLIHFVVHQVHRHRVENDDNNAHDEDEDPRDHVVSEDTAEEAVANHAHLSLFGGIEQYRKMWENYTDFKL